MSAHSPSVEDQPTMPLPPPLSDDQGKLLAFLIRRTHDGARFVHFNPHNLFPQGGGAHAQLREAVRRLYRKQLLDFRRYDGEYAVNALGYAAYGVWYQTRGFKLDEEELYGVAYL